MGRKSGILAARVEVQADEELQLADERVVATGGEADAVARAGLVEEVLQRVGAAEIVGHDYFAVLGDIADACLVELRQEEAAGDEVIDRQIGVRSMGVDVEDHRARVDLASLGVACVDIVRHGCGMFVG